MLRFAAEGEENGSPLNHVQTIAERRMDGRTNERHGNDLMEAYGRRTDR